MIGGRGGRRLDELSEDPPAMLSTFAKLLLTSTAIAPVLLVYAWIAFKSDDGSLVVALLCACGALFLICCVMLGYAKNKLERLEFSLTSIEAADKENMAFLLLYMFPLFTDEFAKFNWDVWVPAIVVFGAVVATGYNYHFNPLLGFMGWHFYKVGTKEGVTYLLITKKQLRSVTDKVTVGQLTEYIVLDVGGDK